MAQQYRADSFGHEPRDDIEDRPPPGQGGDIRRGPPNDRDRGGRPPPHDKRDSFGADRQGSFGDQDLNASGEW